MKLPVDLEPLPGAPAEQVVRVLRQTQTDLINLRGAGGDYKQRVVQYQQWSNQAAQSLGFAVTSESVERLILTQRHWLLQRWTFAPNTGDPVNLVETEAVDRLRLVEQLLRDLQAIEERAAAIQSPLLAPDTNFFLHHEQRFDEVDWRALADAEQLCLLVPWTVVRELDRHKRTGKNVTVSETNSELVRTRARITLRKLRELFPGDPAAPVELAPGVEIELVLDSVKHRAIDDPDSEIVERLATVQSLLGKPVSVVTGDRSMEFAARAEGLQTISIPEPTP